MAYADTSADIFKTIDSGNWGSNINLMILVTLLTLSPAIILTVTSFPRYLISFSFLRQALGVQQMPSNQMLIGLSIFMTIFTMSPTFTKIYNNAYVPFTKHQIESKEMFSRGCNEMKKFMLKQTKDKDLLLFAKQSGLEKLPDSRQDLAITIIAPAYIINEFTVGFKIGFILYMSFLAIDIIVPSVLMLMGMMMVPPTSLSIPLKLLVFLSADGWYLVVDFLMKSFK